MPETRTPADIEADIVRRRQQLAVALDEIAVRVHPQTIMDDAKARLAATVDRTAGRAYVSVNRVLSEARSGFVDEQGSPRLERVLPAAAVGLAVVSGLVLVSSRRKRC